MGRKYLFRSQDKLYFISFATIHWIDVFTRRRYKDILTDSLLYCIENKGMQLYAWCIMSNHVHLIIGTKLIPMQDILRDLKRHTSKELLKAIAQNPQESRKEWILWFCKQEGKRNPNNKDFQFWQQNNHPIPLYNNGIMEQKLNYIHQNPVEAGWVDQAEDYLYSSARDYAGLKGLLPILFIE